MYKKTEAALKQMLEKVPRKEFEAYYFKHSKLDTMKHFHISVAVFDEYIKYYGIQKSKADILETRKNTCLERYGVENLFKDTERIKQSYIEQYGSLEAKYQQSAETAKKRAQEFGVNSMSQLPEVREKRKRTCLKKYGVEHTFQSPLIKQKSNDTKQQKYGDPNYNNREKASTTCLDRYGATCNFGSKDGNINGRNTQMKNWGHENFNNRAKAKRTCLEKYGQNYYMNQIKKMQSSISSRNNSIVNKHFDIYLKECFIEHDSEFHVENFSYDFKIGDYLLEIDPYATHNSSWGIFGNPKPFDYHRNKTLTASNNGYTCIHIFDWTNVDIILAGVLNKSMRIVDTGKPVKHIFNTKTMSLTNKETEDTVIIYDDGFELIY